LLPKARGWARNKSIFQGVGLGIAVRGDHIALITEAGAEDMAVEAIRLALEERGVKVELLPSYTLVGVSRADALALEKSRIRPIEEGYLEVAGWMRGFPQPDAIQQWLRTRRPDLADKLFPKEQELSAAQRATAAKLSGPAVGKALAAYLQKNPGIKGVFWGKGGSSYLRRYAHPFENKVLGLFTVDNRWDLASEMGNYPSDVWQLSEEQTLEALPYIDRIHITDPEGTDVSADLTQEQAARFSQGAYHRGHMFMWPNQAYGRFGYSIVDYPSFQKVWLSPEPMVRAQGLVAGTGHGGQYPRIEVHYGNGHVTRVNGGGTFGEALREFMTHYEPMSKLAYPFHKDVGYWTLYEAALGTNAKAFRHPGAMEAGNLSVERQRSGLIHWGIGRYVQHGPNEMTMPKDWIEFTKANNVPLDHGFHIHTSFNTYRVHLGGADKWLTLVDKGRLTSLDAPEVRALASRYGDPAQILSEDWIPEIPGVNARGSYEAFAREPWTFTYAQMNKVKAGTYEFFYPPQRKTSH
jgi:hypothetical protein